MSGDQSPPLPPPSGPEPGPYFRPVGAEEVVRVRGGGSRGWGIAVGVVGPLLLSLLAAYLSQWSPEAATVVPVLGLLAAVGLAIAPRTRRFGVGVLMGVGISVVVVAGACVAIIAMFAAGGG